MALLLREFEKWGYILDLFRARMLLDQSGFIYLFIIKDGYYKMLFKGENKVIFFKIRNVKLLWECAERTIDILRWIADVQSVIFQ